MTWIKTGVVLCLAAILLGTVAMVAGAWMGEEEDVPKVFQQLAGVSCAAFGLGLIVSLLGWVVTLNKPEAPKPTLADVLGEEAIQDEADQPGELDEQGGGQKPDPYASDHRRRDY